MLSRVHIYYGSQMGRTTTFAEKALKSIKEIERVHVSIKPLDDLVSDTISAGQIVLILTSTFGMGGPPENAQSFHTMLMEDNQQKQKTFDGVLHSVLGIGDSRWQTFCEFPRLVGSKMKVLGGQELSPFCEIDAAEDDHEKKIDTWINTISQKISHLAVQSIDEDTCCHHKSPDLRKEIKPRVVKKEKRVHSVPIQFARYLTNAEDKRIVHLGFDISSTDIRYKPGDCLAIYPENDPALIDLILNHVDEEKIYKGEVEEEEIEEIKEEEFKQMITSQRELNLFLSKDQLTHLINFVQNEKEKEEARSLASNYSSQNQNSQITIFFFLSLFKSTKLSKKWILDSFPIMNPRYYSISCSPLVFPDAVHIVFSVVESFHTFEVSGTTFKFLREGTATSYMERYCKELLNATQEGTISSSSSIDIDSFSSSSTTATSTVPNNKHLRISLRTSNTFTLPSDLSQHVLMVGAGTGVAPFRGFLQHLCFLRQKELGSLSASPRAFGCDSCPLNLLELLGNQRSLPDMEDKPRGLSHTLGQNWLFFGCRHPDLDFLFQDEFEALSDSGTLNVLEIAFSRSIPSDNSVYKYAQHLLHKKEKEIVDLLLSRKAYLYVCGNLNGMTQDTHQKLVSIFSKQKGITLEESESLLEQLSREKRYIRESWA